MTKFLKSLSYFNMIEREINLYGQYYIQCHIILMITDWLNNNLPSIINIININIIMVNIL